MRFVNRMELTQVRWAWNVVTQGCPGWPPKSLRILIMSLWNSGFSLAALAFADLFILWLAFPSVSGCFYLRVKEERFYATPWKFKDLMLGFRCRGWEARGVCADEHATCFHGNQVISLISYYWQRGHSLFLSLCLRVSSFPAEGAPCWLAHSQARRYRPPGRYSRCGGRLQLWV